MCREMQRKGHEELAWAAGFFDAEGSFCVNITHPGKYNYIIPMIAISQYSSGEVLFKFKEVTGLGNVGGPYRVRTKDNNPEIWNYRVYGYEKVQAILAMLWIWLGSIKREQGEFTLYRARNGE